MPSKRNGNRSGSKPSQPVKAAKTNPTTDLLKLQIVTSDATYDVTCSDDDNGAPLFAAWTVWQVAEERSGAEKAAWDNVLQIATDWLEDMNNLDEVAEDVRPVYASDNQPEPTDFQFTLTPVDGPLPADPETFNQQRADAAQRAIESFATNFGEALDEDGMIQQNLSDLLADVAHFCDRAGISLQSMLERAKGHYDEETQPQEAGERQGTQFCFLMPPGGDEYIGHPPASEAK